MTRILAVVLTMVVLQFIYEAGGWTPLLIVLALGFGIQFGHRIATGHWIDWDEAQQ